MTKWKLAGSTAVLALIAGQSALADITPEEVWQKWKDMSASYGQTVTTTAEARDGDTLMIEGATFTTVQDGAESSVAIPKIALKDLGDGTVELTMPDPVAMNIKTPEADGSPASDVVVEMTAPAMTMIASGTVDETSYAVNAAEAKIALVSVDGKTAAETGNDVSATIRNMAGTYASSGTTVTGDVKADAMDIAVKAADPAGEGTFNMAATMNAITIAGNTTTPEGTDMSDVGAVLKAGFVTDNTFGFGQTDFTLDFSDPTGAASGKGTMTNGGLTVAMDAAKLAYGTTYTGLDMTMSGPAIPFPELKIGLAEAAFNLVMPVSKSETPADFALLTKFVDLKVSDEVWGMIDPAGNLPRDPVTLVMDTKGTATLTADIMDPAAMAAQGEAPPGELNSLDLTQLQLKAVGAEVTGSGALTFDNSDLVTFGGMPKPTGTLNFDATGINALLDKVTAMGLVPEDQIMGARMMMGMFAKPGEGEDTLTSLVEFKDGGLFVNGMQLQ